MIAMNVLSLSQTKEKSFDQDLPKSLIDKSLCSGISIALIIGQTVSKYQVIDGQEGK